MMLKIIGVVQLEKLIKLPFANELNKIALENINVDLYHGGKYFVLSNLVDFLKGFSEAVNEWGKEDKSGEELSVKSEVGPVKEKHKINDEIVSEVIYYKKQGQLVMKRKNNKDIVYDFRVGKGSRIIFDFLVENQGQFVSIQSLIDCYKAGYKNTTEYAKGVKSEASEKDEVKDKNVYKKTVERIIKEVKSTLEEKKFPEIIVSKNANHKLDSSVKLS